jgi:Uma2 family endonuclease
MTAAEFLAWADTQPKGRFELVRGEIVAMAPEKARHRPRAPHFAPLVTQCGAPMCAARSFPMA